MQTLVPLRLTPPPQPDLGPRAWLREGTKPAKAVRMRTSPRPLTSPNRGGCLTCPLQQKPASSQPPDGGSPAEGKGGRHPGTPLAQTENGESLDGLIQERAAGQTPSWLERGEGCRAGQHSLAARSPCLGSGSGYFFLNLTDGKKCRVF